MIYNNIILILNPISNLNMKEGFNSNDKVKDFKKNSMSIKKNQDCDLKPELVQEKISDLVPAVSINNFRKVLSLEPSTYTPKSPSKKFSGLSSLTNTPCDNTLPQSELKLSPNSPKNLQSSMNLSSFYLQLYTKTPTNDEILNSMTSISSIISQKTLIDKQEISNSQENLILAIQKNFIAKNSNEKHFNCLTPRSSYCFSSESYDSELELTPPGIRNKNFDSDSTVSDEVLLNSLNLELSMLEWDNKRRNIKNQVLMNTTQNACLIPESEEISSLYMFDSQKALFTARVMETLVSVDIPPEDEGTVRKSVTNRLFLNGDTASKCRLCSESYTKINF
jgi:hypothetical protein